DRTALLEELPAKLSERFLALLDPEAQAVARSLLRYGEQSVGRLMTPDFLAVKKEWTVKRVLEHIRTHGKDRETLNVLYVVDDIRIRDILLAHLHVNVRDLIDNRFVALQATDDKKTAVAVFRKYDRTTLPVVDARGILVGIVTIDDVLDVAEEEATREIQR